MTGRVTGDNVSDVGQPGVCRQLVRVRMLMMKESVLVFGFGISCSMCASSYRRFGWGVGIVRWSRSGVEARSRLELSSHLAQDHGHAHHGITNMQQRQSHGPKYRGHCTDEIAKRITDLLLRSIFQVWRRWRATWVTCRGEVQLRETSLRISQNFGFGPTQARQAHTRQTRSGPWRQLPISPTLTPKLPLKGGLIAALLSTVTSSKEPTYSAAEADQTESRSSSSSKYCTKFPNVTRYAEEAVI